MLFNSKFLTKCKQRNNLFHFRYGRDKELQELKNLLGNEQNHICFVSGYSGSGKSRLIDELSKDPKMNLMMAYGKFDQFNRTTPFFGFLVSLNLIEIKSGS
jgi:predicted ATPase